MKLHRVEGVLANPLATVPDAVIAGPFVFTSAQMADDGVAGIPPEARPHPAYPYYASEIRLQTRYVLKKLGAVLEAAGTSFEHVVKAHVYLTRCADFLGFDAAWKEVFKTPPTRTTVGTSALLVSGARVSIDLVALIPGKGARLAHAKSDAPQPLTKKTEAVRAGDLVFTSGQLAHDAKAGVPPEARAHPAYPHYASNIALQTRYTLANMGRSLAAAGSSLANVVKAQVFMNDITQFAEFDEAWRDVFPVPPPRTTIGVPELLVTGTLLEIDLTAYVPRGGLAPELVRSGEEARPTANQEGLRVGDFVFAAGRLASDFKAGIAPEARVNPAYPHYASAIRLQTRYILNELARTFEAAGGSFEHVVRAQVWLADPADFPGFDEVWAETFGAAAPARTVVGTSALPVPGARVEIDLTGVVA